MIQEKPLASWQKKALDAVAPAINNFAQVHKGHVQASGNEISVRASANGHYVTVQVGVFGKSDDVKLEITGLNQRGIETKHIVFKFTELNMDEFSKALEKTLV